MQTILADLDALVGHVTLVQAGPTGEGAPNGVKQASNYMLASVQRISKVVKMMYQTLELEFKGVMRCVEDDELYLKGIGDHHGCGGRMKIHGDFALEVERREGITTETQPQAASATSFTRTLFETVSRVLDTPQLGEPTALSPHLFMRSQPL